MWAIIFYMVSFIGTGLLSIALGLSFPIATRSHMGVLLAMAVPHQPILESLGHKLDTIGPRSFSRLAIIGAITGSSSFFMEFLLFCLIADYIILIVFAWIFFPILLSAFLYNMLLRVYKERAEL
jgi:hypothetical protein